MATHEAHSSRTSETALRDRIHRVFVGDAPASESATAPPPSFWVGPTEAQREHRVLRIAKQIRLTDEVAVVEERRWLESPHLGLNGKSPEEMLKGDDASRECLDALLTVVESAVRGSFS